MSVIGPSSGKKLPNNILLNKPPSFSATLTQVNATLQEIPEEQSNGGNEFTNLETSGTFFSPATPIEPVINVESTPFSTLLVKRSGGGFLVLNPDLYYLLHDSGKYKYYRTGQYNLSHEDIFNLAKPQAANRVEVLEPEDPFGNVLLIKRTDVPGTTLTDLSYVSVSFEDYKSWQQDHGISGQSDFDLYTYHKTGNQRDGSYVFDLFRIAAGRGGDRTRIDSTEANDFLKKFQEYFTPPGSSYDASKGLNLGKLGTQLLKNENISYTALRSLDTNHDGYVSVQELTAPRRGYRIVSMPGFGPEDFSRLFIDKTGLPVIPPGQVNDPRFTPLVGDLLNYAGLDHMDPNVVDPYGGYYAPYGAVGPVRSDNRLDTNFEIQQFLGDFYDRFRSDGLPASPRYDNGNSRITFIKLSDLDADKLRAANIDPERLQQKWLDLQKDSKGRIVDEDRLTVTELLKTRKVQGPDGKDLLVAGLGLKDIYDMMANRSNMAPDFNANTLPA